MDGDGKCLPGATAYPASAPAAGDDAAAQNAKRTCLMCHVDHDYFRLDQNPQTGGRGKNLRAGIEIVPDSADKDTFSNTDYLQGGGGICVSCHKYAFTKQNADASEPSTTESGKTPVVQAAVFDASSHNYRVPSVVGNNGSVEEPYNPSGVPSGSNAAIVPFSAYRTS